MNKPTFYVMSDGEFFGRKSDGSIWVTTVMNPDGSPDWTQIEPVGLDGPGGTAKFLAARKALDACAQIAISDDFEQSLTIVYLDQ